MGIFVNFAFVVYVREMFDNDRALVFFFLVLISLVFKYLLNISTDESVDQMSKRN